ncbi:WD40 repeat domain-containing protein [Caballeronia humi]|uniref:WD40 repeat domain-containing protein n=1 Tax=Caballeronia humi TaxID=326474 RepID=UPI001358B0C7|nr:hypothetical protein [Caballeronia humi]
MASAVFSPNGRRIASCSTEDPNLRLWDAPLRHLLGLPLEGHGKAVRSLAFSPDSSRIVSVGVDDALRMWDARSGRSAGALIVRHAGPVSSVAFSPDRTRIASGSADKTVRLWDASSGKPLRAPFK